MTIEQRRNVCFISGTRADYGLLQNIMKLTQDSALAESQLIVTGTHLVEDFGYTAHQIENPYKKGNVSIEIFDIIMNNDLKNFMRKPFHDIDLEITKP
ncbi:hypothetical protein [Paremcibacter congregatus]|uniref:hypothetical protein n=1 Tax=Paremcibacter congregatus TaxID=2043170 RepID=UPI0030ED5C9F|tara:strand:+ start:5405 stop:5698 length:294 start_codon:yes stop_codon:yes gene_type:complete